MILEMDAKLIDLHKAIVISIPQFAFLWTRITCITIKIL